MQSEYVIRIVFYLPSYLPFFKETGFWCYRLNLRPNEATLKSQLFVYSIFECNSVG